MISLLEAKDDSAKSPMKRRSTIESSE